MHAPPTPDSRGEGQATVIPLHQMRQRGPRLRRDRNDGNGVISRRGPRTAAGPQTRRARTRRLRRPLAWRCGSQGRQVRPEYRLSHFPGKRASRRREIDHARSRSAPALWWGRVARPDTAGVGGTEESAWRGILLSQRPWSPGWLGVSDGVGAGVCGVAPSTSCCSRVMPS